MLIIAAIYVWWVVKYRPLRRYRVCVLPLTRVVVRIDQWMNKGQLIGAPERDEILFDRSIGRRV